MKSLIFYRTLKSIRKDDRFEAINSSFPRCSIITENAWRECDLAIIQGWMKPGYNSPHNLLRKEIIESQLANKRYVLTIDGNIFNYISKNTLFRYSINGVFANTGYYFDNIIDPTRWKNIKSITGCDLKPWRKNGRHILILMQKSSGWTTQNILNIDWCLNIVKEIKKYSDRDIIVRLHPSDLHMFDFYVKAIQKQNITVSKNISILDDLKNAWCSITYNSSPGAVSAIEGIPVFILDPDFKKSPAWPVGNNNLSNIETPNMPDRNEWIEKLSMSHYTIKDIRDGLLWKDVSFYIGK